jgi:hypothetical protein
MPLERIIKGKLKKHNTQSRLAIALGMLAESRLEGVNRAKLKFTKLITTTSRVSIRNIIESVREGAKQIASK